jgi:hypothetical protein
VPPETRSDFGKFLSPSKARSGLFDGRLALTALGEEHTSFFLAR